MAGYAYTKQANSRPNSSLTLPGSPHLGRPARPNTPSPLAFHLSAILLHNLRSNDQNFHPLLLPPFLHHPLISQPHLRIHDIRQLMGRGMEYHDSTAVYTVQSILAYAGDWGQMFRTTHDRLVSPHTWNYEFVFRSFNLGVADSNDCWVEVAKTKSENRVGRIV